MAPAGNNSNVTLRRISLLLLLIAVVVGAHLLPGFSGSAIERSVRNAFHIIGFAVIGGVLFETIRLSQPGRTIVALFGVALLGLLSEFVQARFTGIDVGDLARDVAGAAIFIFSRILWGKSKNIAAGRNVIRGLSILVGAVIVIPLIYWSIIFGIHANRFPVILDFEYETDTMIFEPIDANVTLVDANSTGEDFVGAAAKIELLRRGWSGIRIEPVVSDWSDYRYLTFRISMIGDTRTRFDVHLSDGEHPGLRTQHLIGGDPANAEPTIVRFPLRDVVDIPGRPDLDLTNIDVIHIIGKDRQAGAIMYLDDIRLE